MKINSASLPRLAILLAIALAVQLLRLPQLVTGPVVNAALILATYFGGAAGGVLIGVITPVVAIFAGILPPALAPVLPVIVAANAILVLFFVWMKKFGDYMAAVVASCAKFLTFFVMLNYVLVLFNINLPKPLLLAFGLPQLYTALAGSLVAVLIAKRFLKRVN